jgi:hypothetical protein
VRGKAVKRIALMTFTVSHSKRHSNDLQTSMRTGPWESADALLDEILLRRFNLIDYLYR